MADRRPHTIEEIQDIAIWLQQNLLAVMCQLKKWQMGDIAFQGGTSLRLMRNSPRFSEDLDFLVRPEVRLSPLMEKAHQHMQGLIKKTFGPEAELRLKSRKDDKNPLLYKFILERPARLGNVEVKVEFFVTEKAMHYNAEPSISNPTLKYIDGFALKTAEFSFLTGSIEQIFWDKLYAIVYRPYIKNRDLFDLAWLQQYGVPEPEATALDAAVSKLHSMYGNTEDLNDFLCKLEQRRLQMVEPGFQKIYTDEMSRWLPAHSISSAATNSTLAAVDAILSGWIALSNQSTMEPAF